jgi:hypothetical protein
VPYGQLGNRQDVVALNDMRLGQLDRLLDQRSTEDLIPVIAPRSYVDFLRLVLHQLQEVRIVIGSM